MVRNNDSENWKKGVDIHGLNKISIDRGKMIVDVQVPFEKTDITLDELVPEYIAKFIRSKKESVADNKMIYHQMGL